MKNILVVNVNWLGDVIFSSPVFYALREKYPKAKITCMAVPRVREILEAIDVIDEIIEYDEEGKDRGLFSKLKFVGKLKRSQFDAAFLLSRSFSRASMVALAKIPVRVGYDHKNRGKLLSHVASQLDSNSVHRSDYYLGVIKSFGVPVNNIETRLAIRKEDQQFVSNLLKDNNVNQKEFIVALNPGGNWDLKRWPSMNYSRLVDLLGQQVNIRILLTGARNDQKLVEEILSRSKQSGRVTKLTGKLSLRQLIALMDQIDVFVTADSGPLHIASSVGCHTISLFGPTRPELTGPRGSGDNVAVQKDVGCNRKACYHLKCNDNICMQAVTVGEIYESIKRIQNS